ncbi:MAG: sulfotransferase domain-containing protein [Pseudomonadota bacterium]
MTGNIVWLASYPKSGNTWFRAFIANLISESAEPVDINKLPPDGNSRASFDAATGLDSTHLLPEEIDRLRPVYYDRVSAASRDAPCFYKIHDAWRRLSDGQVLFPPEATRCSIYIVRNPLDVAQSFAHFLCRDLDRVIAEMNDDDYYLNREERNITRMLPQKISDWSSNVLSWLEAPADMKVHLIRYEDMLRNPLQTFTRAVCAFGLDKDEAAILQAIAHSSFATLKAMELKSSFREKPPKADSFFRTGRSGAWRAVLSDAQVAALIAKHHAVMRRLGYLDEAGNIVDL